MKRLTFIYTAEGLKAYEKPNININDYDFDGGYSYDVRVKNEQARSAALIVENPEVLFIKRHDGWFHPTNGGGEEKMWIGKELECPSTVEWEVVYQIRPSGSWNDCSKEIHDRELNGSYASLVRQVIRLSVKKEEKPGNVLSVEEMKLEAYVDMIKDMTTIEGICLLKSLLSSTATPEPKDQRPTIESFNKISDIRIYLLNHPDKEMIRDSCLHYLGDRFQEFASAPEPEEKPELSGNTGQLDQGESQEEMWGQVINDYRWYDGSPQSFSQISDHLKKRFTITRK